MEDRQEVKMTFSKRGDLRFISHRNIASLLERAVRRAGIPVAFSRGYNPRPRISFPSALETGVASDGEVAFIRLEQRPNNSLLAEDLAAALPDEMTVLGMEKAGKETPRSMNEAGYTVRLPEACGLDQEDLDRAREAGTATRARSGKSVRLSRYVRTLQLRGRNLEMEIAADADGSLRPREVLKTLCVDDPLALDVRRTHVALS
jgi:radical SAM-linked protein